MWAWVILFLSDRNRILKATPITFIPNSFIAEQEDAYESYLIFSKSTAKW